LICLFAISQSATCQKFSFSYDEIGLGSNWGRDPTVQITIFDTLLIYSYYDGVKTPNGILPRGDTLWKHVLTPHQKIIDKRTIEKITFLISGMKGKSIIASDPMILSGGIQNFYFEFENSCVEFSLKNTSDSTMTSVINLLNEYLPEKRKINVFFDGDLPPNKFRPIVENCPSDKNKKYSDYLKNDYQIIQQSNH